LFDGHLARQGYIARGGQILDASIVPVPRNHNTRDENTAIKKGEVPEDWADKPAKRCQKDLDARWSEEDQKTVRGTVFPTNKHGKSHYGTKNHINVDRMHKLVRRYHVTDAAVHDSQAVDHLLMQGNTGSGVWQIQLIGPKRWRPSCARASSRATFTARASGASRWATRPREATGPNPP